MIQTITLAQARAWDACRPWIDGLIARLGREPGPDESIPLPVVLEALDIEDTLWCLAHLDWRLLVRFTLDCAEVAAQMAEPLLAVWEAEHPEDCRPRAALEAAAELRAALRAASQDWGALEEVWRLMAAADDAAHVAQRAGIHFAASAADAAIHAAAVINYALAALPASAVGAADAALIPDLAAVQADYALDALGAYGAYGDDGAYGADAACQKKYLWCRERLRAYLEGRDPGPVSIETGEAP